MVYSVYKMIGFRTLLRIQIIMVVVFMILKRIRPQAIEAKPPEWVSVILFSFPNLAEAVIGVIMVAMILLVLNSKVSKPKVTENVVYTLSVFISGAYVISQEFKLHNLGGNNIYDLNDVLFSILGLLIAFLLLKIIKPRVS